MQLYIQRHAIAEPLAESNEFTDSERALTTDGIEKMRRVAKGMQSLGLCFDQLLSSPFKRAVQTAEIVIETLNPVRPLEIVPELAAGTNVRKTIQALRKFQNPNASLLIFGHEPDLSNLISTLISGDLSVPITMKKGGLCSLTVDSLRSGRCATLEWLLTPAQLRKI